VGRSVMLGNGHMLVGLNDSGLVHDFYYPYVGLDNLTTSRSIHHNVGIWINGEFSWLDGGEWDLVVDFEEDALISDIKAFNKKYNVQLVFKDFVDCQYSAFCRYITIHNNSEKNLEVRIFMHQAFQISRAGRGDTALYVPNGNYLLDYKGWCSLLIFAQNENGQPFDQFSVGNYGIEDKEGTFRDAEDGTLDGNLVEHGGVDSVVRCVDNIAANDSTTVSYWVVASQSQFDAEIVHHMLLAQGLPKRLDVTRQHWRDWLAIGKDKLSSIDQKYLGLTKKSLLVVKAHIDRHGGIIASCDSSIYNYGKDYYSYVWPRDGALTMLPLIALGYTHEPKKFFEFCADTMHPGGYMMHKYQPDRAVGSTWHPLLNHHHPELAIQEDETAIIIYAMGVYLQVSQDKEFLNNLYDHYVKPCTDFLASFVDQATHLPHASYDLWEERFATHTYTVCVTIAALEMGSYIAHELGKDDDAQTWKQVANGIEANIKLLFNEDRKYYRKSLLLLDDGKLEFNDTLDVSNGLGFLLLDPKLQLPGAKDTFLTMEKILLNSSPSGGCPRYEHDNYFLSKTKYLGNPWIIGTLWMSQFYLINEQKDEAVKLIDWVKDHTSSSGMLPEQVDPETGAAEGVSPLVWSHAVFVETVLMLSGLTN
jgi:GH15 family glucan-1,4-alpha-glucosidase